MIPWRVGMTGGREARKSAGRLDHGHEVQQRSDLGAAGGDCCCKKVGASRWVDWGCEILAVWSVVSVELYRKSPVMLTTFERMVKPVAAAW